MKNLEMKMLTAEDMEAVAGGIILRPPVDPEPEQEGGATGSW